MFRRIILAGTLLVTSVLLWSQSRSPLDPGAEPHHHLILANQQVRVFAVTIPPGEEVYVRHVHNFLTVTLENARIVMWTENAVPGLVFPVSDGDTRFFIGGTAMGIRNDGPADYKNITVDFLDPGVTNYGYQYNRGGEQPSWDYGSSALAPPVDAQSGFVHALPLQQVVVRDVRLLPGSEFAPPEQPRKELLIAVSDLRLGAGEKELRKQAGAVAWLEGRGAALMNHGAESARIVVVELK